MLPLCFFWRQQIWWDKTLYLKIICLSDKISTHWKMESGENKRQELDFFCSESQSTLPAALLPLAEASRWYARIKQPALDFLSHNNKNKGPRSAPTVCVWLCGSADVWAREELLWEHSCRLIARYQSSLEQLAALALALALQLQKSLQTSSLAHNIFPSTI